jgi:hypothetical protein
MFRAPNAEAEALNGRCHPLRPRERHPVQPAGRRLIAVAVPPDSAELKINQAVPA